MNILSRIGDQIVTLDEAKANSRVTTSAEDSLFQHWIDVAHEQVEKETGLVLQQSICSQVVSGCSTELSAPVRGLIGADDLDGTIIEEKITHMAGATSSTGLTRQKICGMIQAAGWEPVERDSFYNEIIS